MTPSHAMYSAALLTLVGISTGLAVDRAASQELTLRNELIAHTERHPGQPWGPPREPSSKHHLGPRGEVTGWQALATPGNRTTESVVGYSDGIIDRHAGAANFFSVAPSTPRSSTAAIHARQ